MTSETQHLSRSAFAASQGWSPSYVTKLSKQDRLVFADETQKLIDVGATLAVLARTEDPEKEAVRQHHAGRRSANMVRPDKAGKDEEPESATADPTYWAAKARRESALAELAEHELAKKRGDLVERVRVESAAYAVGRMLRDAVLGMPPQLAPQIVGMSDAFQVEQLLRTALRKVLEDHARMTADDMARAMEATH
ncbi:MAG: terminase small subunit [Pseudomonadota bacterium]|nr:terminase small subunit [Pseudomonadota bacterium]MDP1905049.1 terminase small subunit [Pseudomonadota bacterium]MDP2354290.1 terminase small subunit [Pseudomonadota bacterium]